MGEAIISRSGGGSSSEIVTPPTPTANMHMLMLKVTDSEGTPLKDWPVQCARSYYYHTNEAGYVTFATNKNVTQIDVAPYAFYNSEGMHSPYNNFTDHSSVVFYADQDANCVNFETPIGLSQVASLKLKERNGGQELNFLDINGYNVYRTHQKSGTAWYDINIYNNGYARLIPDDDIMNKFIGMPINLIFVKQRNCNIYLSGAGGGGGWRGGGGAGGEQKELNGIILKGSYNAFIGQGGKWGNEPHADYNNYNNAADVSPATAGGTTFIGQYSAVGGGGGHNGVGGKTTGYAGNGANGGKGLGENSGMRFGGGGSSHYGLSTSRTYDDRYGWQDDQTVYNTGFFNNKYAYPCGGVARYKWSHEDDNRSYATSKGWPPGPGGGGGGGNNNIYAYSGGKKEYSMLWGVNGGNGIIIIKY